MERKICGLANGEEDMWTGESRLLLLLLLLLLFNFLLLSLNCPSDFSRCNSVQNLLSSSLLSRNFKIKIYRTLIFPEFPMGVKLGRSH